MIKDVNKICKVKIHEQKLHSMCIRSEDTAVKIGPKILSCYGTNGIILCAVILYWDTLYNDT